MSSPRISWMEAASQLPVKMAMMLNMGELESTVIA